MAGHRKVLFVQNYYVTPYVTQEPNVRAGAKHETHREADRALRDMKRYHNRHQGAYRVVAYAKGRQGDQR